MEALQAELETTMRQVPQWEREHRDAIRDLSREVSGLTIGHLMTEIRADYADLPDVAAYLDSVERDAKENVDDFLPQPVPQTGSPLPGAVEAELENGRFRRYRVNVIVDNGGKTGAPVVYEETRRIRLLVGRVEHIARFGALVTDFNLLTAGALHHAPMAAICWSMRRSCHR
jgi:predicted ATP-dependent protease